MRIIVQFIGQIFALHVVRREKKHPLPFRMWLYPLPSLVALVGWVLLLASTAGYLLSFIVIIYGSGLLVFILRDPSSSRVTSNTLKTDRTTSRLTTSPASRYSILLRNLLFAGRRFIFDEIPFHACLLRCRENATIVDETRADSDIIGHIGAAREQPRRRTLLHVLKMDERETLSIFLEQADRILPAVNDPEDIHLIVHKLGLGFRHQQVKQRSRTVWLKLEAVRVVEKLDAVLRERFAGLIEILNRGAAIFFREGAAMRDPAQFRRISGRAPLRRVRCRQYHREIVHTHNVR